MSFECVGYGVIWIRLEFSNKPLLEEVYQQTYTLLQRTTAYPNFVISTGCDVPPEVPLDNIRAFYEAVKDYNQKQ